MNINFYLFAEWGRKSRGKDNSRRSARSIERCAYGQFKKVR